jgi:signal transduction histidine kinase
MDILGLERTLKEAMAQMEGEIKEKNADIQVKKPLLEVVGNPTTLILILGNILNNAIKFHAPDKKPKVKIWAKEKNEMVRLYVKDNGIGIDPKYNEKVFRVFERLHGKNQYPGTGIGLAIVKKGVERMGGSVGFKSTLGHGTTFWIDLPKPEGKE